LKEEKESLGGHLGDQQEGTSSDSEHYERPEMMILRLPPQWAFFFHWLSARRRRFEKRHGRQIPRQFVVTIQDQESVCPSL
jgi:hypothetical protein